MREIDRILDQMDRSFSADAWHGPSLMSALEGVSPEGASKHPIGGAHSIWELVHHVSSWNTIVITPGRLPFSRRLCRKGAAPTLITSRPDLAAAIAGLIVIGCWVGIIA